MHEYSCEWVCEFVYSTSCMNNLLVEEQQNQENSN